MFRFQNLHNNENNEHYTGWKTLSFAFLLTILSSTLTIKLEKRINTCFSYNLGNWPESFYEITVMIWLRKKTMQVNLHPNILYFRRKMYRWRLEMHAYLFLAVALKDQILWRAFCFEVDRLISKGEYSDYGEFL